MYKICSNPKCLQPKKLLSEFSKDKSRKDGYCSQCKQCIKKYKDVWDKLNKIRQSNKAKIHYLNNKERYKEWADNDHQKCPGKGYFIMQKHVVKTPRTVVINTMV